MPRIVTYNVHSCIGADRRRDLARVADVIAGFEPDIVALQELDVGRRRTGRVDQAREIARRLDMACHFNAAMRVEEEQYGDAILTRYPERLIKAGLLPGLEGGIPVEPRGALWLAIDVDGVEVNVVTAHMGHVPREQQRQASALVGPDWLGGASAGPSILLGDFNATRVSAVCRIIGGRLKDARRIAKRRRASSTFPSAFPLIRIDHIFVSADISVAAIDAPYNALTRVASDHLPLVMDFSL